jgi:hypothetical protein
MATITTQTLNKNVNTKDTVAVKVDTLDYVGKTGIIKVTLTQLQTFASANVGTVTGSLRVGPANYNVDNDVDLIIKQVPGQTQLTITIGKDYYFSVNNGIIGPAAKPQLDGTVDLINVDIEIPTETGFTNYFATLTYSVTFTDLLPTVTQAATTTLQLNLPSTQERVFGIIPIAAATLAAKSGYLTLLPLSLQTVTISGPATNNGPPHFNVAFNNASLIAHYLTVNSGIKAYPLSSIMIFAVNNGKVDNNSDSLFLNTLQKSLCRCHLARTINLPGDADVTISFAYSLLNSLLNF